MSRWLGAFAIAIAALDAAGSAVAASIDPDAAIAVEQDMARALSVVGRTVSRVHIESKLDLAKEASAQFMKLEGKPLEILELRNLVRWFNETVRDTRLTVKAEKSAAGVELTFEIAAKRKIETVEYYGNASFGESELSALVAISEGDDFEEEALEGARRKIIEFYRNAGFLQAEVTIEVVPEGVRFRSNEGGAATIRSINFSEITVVGDRRERNLLQKSALSAFGVGVGDRLDRRTIKDGIARLKDWLRSRDFLIAKEPVVNSVVYDAGTSANLDITIIYGPRVRFGFRNNERYSYKDLIAAVAEVQEVGIGADYLDTVKSKITEMYHEVGLVNFKVETVVREDPAKGYRHVRFVLHEGEGVRIERISFEGIYSTPKEESAKLFLSFAPPLVQRYYF